MTTKGLMILRRNRAAIIVALLLAFTLLAPRAHASDIRSGQTVVIESDEVINDDLIVTGEVVRIDGTITGDLIATGTTIILNGNVEGSVLAIGQSLNIGGAIGGSMYGLSATADLGESATVGRNMYFGGYALETGPGSTVENSLYYGGYQLRHDGQIGRNLVFNASAVEINGSVGGDVSGEVEIAQNAVSPQQFIPGGITVSPVAPGFEVGETAEISGQTQVTEVTVTVPQAAVPETGPLGLPRWFTNRLGEFIGLMLVGALIVYLLPNILPAVGDDLLERPLPSFGWGLLLMFIALPVGVIAGGLLVILLTVVIGWITFGELTGAVLTLSGSFLLFALFTFLFMAYIVAKVVVGYTGGRWILTRFKVGSQSASRWLHVGYLALGVLIYEVLRAIPVVGWLVALLVVVTGVGAMFDYWLARRRQPQKAPQPMPAIAAD